MAEEGPWTKFQSAPSAADAAGPWAKYQTAQPEAPAPASAPKFEPWVDTPIDAGMRSFARTVVPPIANFVDYPVRAAAADIVGAVKGGIPTDEKSRESFYRERDKSLQQTRIPETKGGEKISEIMGLPGQWISSGVKALGNATIGPSATKALGPAATVAGDVAPLAVAGRAAAKGGSSPPVANVRPAAVDARQAGYVLPPAAISDKPGIVANVLAGWSGKIKTQQAASEHNQSITNDLGAQALGLPKGAPLNDQVFQKVRADAGKAYQAVANAVPVIAADAQYISDINSLTGKNSQVAALFPKITNNPGLRDLVDELQTVPQIPTDVAVELVKELRFNGNTNLKAIGDPSKHALGLAQRSAANAIDDLMDREITVTGQPNLIAEYRKARQLIAKSYDLEGVTNPATGDVNARGLARLATKGKPLTGELDTIANAANAFPKAMQPPAGFGHNESLSALDFFGSAASIAHGNPGVAAAILGRPAARAAVLSDPFQDWLFQARSPFLGGGGGVAAGEVAQPHDDTKRASQHMGLQ